MSDRKGAGEVIAEREVAERCSAIAEGLYWELRGRLEAERPDLMRGDDGAVWPAMEASIRIREAYGLGESPGVELARRDGPARGRY